MKSIKEKQLLVKWSRAMNEDIDPALLEEVERYEKLQNEIIESIRQNSIKDLAEASSVAVELVTKVQEYPKPPTLDEVLSIIQEEQNELVQSQAVEEPAVTEEAPVPEPAPTTLIDKTVDLIKTEQKSFQQPDPQPVDKNFEAVQKKLKFLEQAIGKIAATGPGGGAVWLRELNDVDYTSVRSPSDSDVLTFNASTGKWEAAAATGGSGSVPTLHQVTNRGNVTTNGITVNNANANFIALNTTAGYSVTEGQIAWNAADLTFDMGMANGSVLQVGQEQYVKIKAANAIVNGKPIMYAGVSGEHILGTHCDLNAPNFRPEFFIGVATHDISKNGFGYVTTFGKVHNVNTLTWNDGDNLFVDPGVIGGLTNIEPIAPNVNIQVAVVTKRAGGDGHILVNPAVRFLVSQLNDVALTNPVHGQSLVFDGGNVWRNQWLTTANVVELTNLYFTNARAVSAVTEAGITSLDNNGYTFALAADGTVSITDNIFNTGTNPVTFWSNDSVTSFWRSPTGGGPGQPLNSLIQVDANGATIALDTGVLGLGSRLTWVYNFDGSITFPDSSIQTTAFNNTAVYSNVISLGYITSSALSGYATNSQLSSYATTANLALKANIADLTSANVTEKTNLYFTNARSRAAISVSGAGSYDSATGIITINTSSSSYGDANVYSNVTQLGYITSSALNGYATNSQVSALATTANLVLKANIADLTTANVTEVTNLYFTNARVYSNVTSLGYITSSSLSGYATNAQLASYATNAQLAIYATNAQLASYATTTNVALKANVVDLTTANVTEVTNLYFTNARVYSNVTSLGYITSSSLSGYATNSQLTSYATTSNLALKANVVDLTTANVTEDTNLYFTNERVISALDVGVADVSVISRGINHYGSLAWFTDTEILGQPFESQVIVDEFGVTVVSSTGTSGARLPKEWNFGSDGLLQFPDTTFQTTAFTPEAVYANVITLGYAKTSSLTTANVTEVSNLYFTNTRVYSNITQLGYITSSSLNGYATNSQLTSYATTANLALKANIADLTTANIAEVTNLYYTNARVYANVITLGYAKTANLTTANVTEVTNLYFTNARATAAVTNTTLSNISIGGFANITYQPATTSGAAINILAANTKGGTGYADILQITNTSGGAVNPNKYIRIGSFGTFEIINSAYNGMPFSLTDNGDLTVSGNVIMSGVKSGYSAARPGFRVYGAGTTNNLSTTQNSTGALNGNNWDIDFNQGSYLNDSTGVFTAPVAGLYQINVVGRNAGNASISQLAAVKNASGGTGSGGTVACMLEFGGSSSMNHAGVSTVVQLAVGDTIALKVLAGTINFDSNDNWSMAYLG